MAGTERSIKLKQRRSDYYNLQLKNKNLLLINYLKKIKKIK